MILITLIAATVAAAEPTVPSAPASAPVAERKKDCCEEMKKGEACDCCKDMEGKHAHGDHAGN